ncbi:putative malate dehydrogenase 1B [Rhizophlyctis rosea]|uniref:Malate dehydrogenase 1B n=1 Tax=Rhizophlyctis rosea TaxID=64517 RepID=A0AAD5SHM4_9FUNG|nr:putative malate dehydrogenase 1B [Rhizophlyctis rosea]
MADFILAGKADDPQYARAEMLGHHLSLNLPHYRFEPRPIVPDEWDEVARKIYVQYDWADRPARDRTIKVPGDALQQMVWRRSGELIGNANDFISLMKATYNQELDISQDTLDAIAQENLKTLLDTKK